MSRRIDQVSPDQRFAAPELYRALCQMYLLWSGGERDANVLRDAAGMILKSEPAVETIDYVSVADMSTLDELQVVESRVMVSAAVWMGAVRLIDNIVLE